MSLTAQHGLPMILAAALLPAAPMPAQGFDLPWQRDSDAAPAVAPPRPVVTEILSDRAEHQRPVPGSVVARNEVDLAFMTLGRLIERPVELGDMVNRDEVLARLDPEDLDDQVRAARAAVTAAQAQYDTTLATATRTRFLATREVASAAQLEQVENALASTEAALSQAQSQLIRALDQQGFADIIAPFDGVISAIHAEPGEIVQAGMPVLTLSGRRMREAVIDLTEGELADIGTGTVWMVWQEANPDLRFAAPVDRIAPMADIRTRTRRVHLTLPATVPFRLGALIRAAREGAGAQGMTLPASAILQDGAPGEDALNPGAAAVWAVTRDAGGSGVGHVSLRAVTILPRPDGQVNVIGLDPGAEIVTRGIHSLTEGQPVGRSIAP